MAINISELMGKSSSAAQAALGLRYGTVAQPPALNFVQPALAASASATKTQDEVTAPITEQSVAGVVKKTNDWATDLMNKVMPAKKPTAAATGATK